MLVAVHHQSHFHFERFYQSNALSRFFVKKWQGLLLFSKKLPIFATPHRLLWWGYQFRPLKIQLFCMTFKYY